MLLSLPEISAQRGRAAVRFPRLYSAHVLILKSLSSSPRTWGKHDTTPDLISQEEISATRPSGKCSFQEEFWETEEGCELLQPIRAWFGHMTRAVRWSGVVFCVCVCRRCAEQVPRGAGGISCHRRDSACGLGPSVLEPSQLASADRIFART